MKKIVEGSPEDVKRDKKEAKKRGMTMRQWESSAADKKEDARLEKAGKLRGRK